MSDLLRKCSVCRAMIDEEDLFCGNCGTEAPPAPGEAAAMSTQTSTHNFDCQGCGASMSYDASAQTLRCPFCGSEKLKEAKDKRTLAPRRCLEFVVGQRQAASTLKKWLGSSFWRPGDLASTAVITKITAVYVPYWVFDASTYTYWTADSSRTPPGASGDWFPLSGHHRGRHQGLLIGASSALTPRETHAICPFDLSRAVDPQQVDLDNAIVEQFRVQRKYARPLARQGLESLEARACTQYVPGRARNLKVNVRIEDLRSEPVVVPVWIMAYRYHEQVYRFLINGQTGRHTGTAPFSWKKLVVVAVIVLAAAAVVMGVMGLLS